MTLNCDDIVINDQVIRGLSPKNQGKVVEILDEVLAPNLWSGEFDASTSTSGRADLHLLRGKLKNEVQSAIESAVGKKFTPITDKEELADIEASKRSLRER